MVALSYILDTARVNGKTVQCFKNDPDILSTSSYDFSWNLAKALALPHVHRRNVYGLASSVQLKIKMLLGTALLADQPVLEVERRFTGAGQRRRCQLHMDNFHTKTEKDNALKATEQCQYNMVSVFAGNIQCEFAMDAYNEILIYISYSFCLSFRLCSGMIVFHTSLEVIKLVFLENKSRYVCHIFPNFIFTFETKCYKCLKKIMCYVHFMCYVYLELCVCYRPNQ